MENHQQKVHLDTSTRRSSSSSHANGSVRRTSGGSTTFIMDGFGNRPISLPDTPNSPTKSSPTTATTATCKLITVIINSDDKGYGMKVSGDNPVYVQGVKEGGAAEKAGLHIGDRIVEVNGENVLSSTHTDVVDLIKSSTQVILKVQHVANNSNMGSPGIHGRPLVIQNNSTRITGPRPVDNEKQVQLQLDREKHYMLMIEKEQRYVDLLRSQIVTSSSLKKTDELRKAERNLDKLFKMLATLQEMKPRDELTLARDHLPFLPSTPPPPPKQVLLHHIAGNGNGGDSPPPPPLPKRNSNRTLTADAPSNPPPNAPYANGQEENGNEGSAANDHVSFTGKQCLNAQSKRFFAQTDATRDRCASFGSRLAQNSVKNASASMTIVDNKMYASSGGGGQPPPLPPRVPVHLGYETDGANSISKQLSYPLVATCATLVNNCMPNHSHQRTKSSPESLINLNPSEASQRLIASESMTDLSRPNEAGYTRNAATPPGTPPPPYPSPLPVRKSLSNRNSAHTDDGDGSFEEIHLDTISSPDVSPLRGPSFAISTRKFMNSSPIHAATPPISQQAIISMEDDEISESDLSQIEDHGPFKSISQLLQKENMPYLAVFVNYVLLNLDPSSLLFYLITDLYKEGNAKEMRKWAYEIQSCFLIPTAPLRISNVDESVVREIDEVLSHENNGEEILRKVFWKARVKAKEELTKQLTDFQQKRVAGMGTIYGPKDATLSEIVTDKTGGKDIKLYESLLLEKLNCNDDCDSLINTDPKKYYMTAAIITVVTRVFGVRVSGPVMERWQTFVTKDKSLKNKFIGRPSRKPFSIYGHTYVAQQYFTVINCNNCTQIIIGIGPQGFTCSTCNINLHRNCISHYNDHCPGPLRGKGKGGKFMDRIRNERHHKRKQQSSIFINMEKERRSAEEKDNGVDFDNGEYSFIISLRAYTIHKDKSILLLHLHLE